MDVSSCENDDHVVEGVSKYGTTLKWFKVKFLGKGSFGVVHQVMPLENNNKVYAVKSCADEYSSSLRKEAEILKRFIFCHHVVQCSGDMLSVEHGRRVFNIFLEFAASGTLLDLIYNKKYGGKIPESDARCYARMVVKGLLEIHERGYVHCDIKPENILVFPSEYHYGEVGRLKIADFGLARRHGEIIKERKPEELKGRPWLPVFPGTPIYMPPESVNHARIDPSLDIWSLGCVVLQMMTGKLPWQYRSRIDLVLKLVDPKITHPEIPCGAVSREGVDFLTKCFARDPAQRWTAKMLLSHPFLQLDPPRASFVQPDLPSRTSFLQHHAQAKYSSHLPMGFGMLC